MNVLLVAATELEVAKAIKLFPKVKTLITGVGIPATVYALGKALAENKYDVVINAGIAGTFDTSLPLGTVLEINKDRFADIGAQDGDNFLDVFELQLTDANQFPYVNGWLVNNFSSDKLPLASAITVNKVHGNQPEIDFIHTKYSATIESMEGAAVAYVCQMEGVKYLQFRSISNVVEKRNRDAWNIPLAIENLNDFLKEQLKLISTE